MDNLIFGVALRMQEIKKEVENLALSKAIVLIVGESGVGKKTIAEFIHKNSLRNQNPYEIVDCSLGPQKVEDELFGHRDLTTSRFIKGALEKANSGSVILANIDLMDEALQAKLYRILNELEDYDIDIRLICTSSRPLLKLINLGQYHKGLGMKLSGQVVNIPPLRDRPEDIEYQSRRILNSLTNEETFIEQDALAKLLGHYWSQNTNELKQVIERSMENLRGNALSDISLDITETSFEKMSVESENEGFKLMSLRDAEKLLIKKALIHTCENRTQAAKILGVSIRTLRNKINEYRSEGSSYFVNLR